MHIAAGKRYIIPLFALLLLIGMSACGTHFPSTSTSATPSPTKFSNIPLGKGMDPEPGTDGKSAPLSNGHIESMVIANGLTYIGSDNGSLYALGLNDGKVHYVEPDGIHSCPNMPWTNGLKSLTSSQVNTYMQVTFANTTQYVAALNAVNGLGFRLAAPCYGQARAQGNKPTWHSMDQSSAFNQAHTLVLATTLYNATTWQSQLRAVMGVGKVNVPFKAGC